MQKKLKVAAGSAAALALIVAGGIAIALPAQASTISTTTSVVEPVSATDTDNVQEQVGDQTGTDAAGTEAAGTETAEGTGTENTADDINGVAVEDGTKN